MHSSICKAKIEPIEDIELSSDLCNLWVIRQNQLTMGEINGRSIV